MFDQDYFTEPQETGPGRTGKAVGMIGGWGLHLAKVAFLIYSGYHGINATMAYHGTSELAMAAGIVGITVTEVVMFSLYLAWHNQKITGAAQSITAGLTYAVGFVICVLAIVVDSRINAGIALPSWLASYLQWGLPSAPAVMALGALLVHELAPAQLRKRKMTTELDSFDEEQFNAHMATQRAEMETARMIKNMQLNTRMATAKQIAQAYSGDDVQRAIASTARQNIPALLRAIGVNVEDVPDVNQNGEVDPEDLRAYIEALQAQVNRPRPQGEPVILNPNGAAARPTNGRGDGR